MEHERDRFDEKAREMLRAGKRDEAKRVLKLKQVRVKAVNVARESIHKMQLLVVNIETKQQQIDMMKGMEAGTSLLERLNSELPPERVEEILGASEDAVAEAWQTAEMIASSSSGEPPIDEAALNAELDALVGGASAAPPAAAPVAAGAAAAAGTRAGEDDSVDASKLPDAPTEPVQVAEAAGGPASSEASGSGRVAVPAS